MVFYILNREMHPREAYWSGFDGNGFPKWGRETTAITFDNREQAYKQACLFSKYCGTQFAVFEVDNGV